MEGFVTIEIKKKKFELYQKVRDHCHYTGKFRGAAHSICNLCYKVPKKPVAFHNGSKYDYHFVIKQLAEVFEDQFECLGENTEKYISFSVPIEKEVITDDEEDGSIKEEEEEEEEEEENDSDGIVKKKKLLLIVKKRRKVHTN